MYPRRPLHQTMKRKLAKQSEYATSIHSPPFFKGGGGTYSLNLNLKTYCFTYCGGSYVPVGIFLLYLYLSSSLSQSQIIFVLFVACVASVSVWFGAKKDRGRGSVFGFDRAKNETKTKNWKRGQGEGLDLHKCSLTKTVSFLLRTLFLVPANQTVLIIHSFSLVVTSVLTTVEPRCYEEPRYRKNCSL